MMKRDRAETFALGLLILLAAALRFYRLAAQDIWGDEAFSIFLSQQSLNVVLAGASDTHPPFYPLLLFVWLQLAGATAFATRALSALIGILAVPLIFVLANSITLQPRVRWFAAILLAVSPLMIYYSQETRMYELVTILCLASSYWMLKCAALWRRRSDAGEQRKQSSDFPPYLRAVAPLRETSSVFYVVFTLLALYTHYSAFFVLAAQNIFALIHFRNQRAALMRWLVRQIFFVIAYLPWIIVQSSFLRGKASARFDEWGWAGIEMIFGKTFLAFSAGVTTEFPIPQIAAVLFLTFAVFGVYAMARAPKYSATPLRSVQNVAWFVPLYFLVPILIAYGINPIMPFFFERYVLVALPGFLLLVAFGLDRFAGHDHRAALGMLVLFVSISAFALFNFYFDDTYAKGKYGKMMTYVSQNAQPGDVLILNNPLQKPLYRYYAPTNVPAHFFPDGGASLEEPHVRQELEHTAKKSARVWLVMFGNPAEYDPTGYLEKWFGANAFKSYFGGYVDASLHLYVMPSAAPAIRRSELYTLGKSIQLVGFDLDRADPKPGQSVLLTLHWKTTAPVDNRYTVFAHIIGAVNPATQSPVWAQMDSEPAGGARPTSTWQIDEVIDDRHGLLLPRDTPPGEYLIEIGMYDSSTQTRLPVIDGTGVRLPDDRVILGTVRVVTQ